MQMGGCKSRHSKPEVSAIQLSCKASGFFFLGVVQCIDSRSQDQSFILKVHGDSEVRHFKWTLQYVVETFMSSESNVFVYVAFLSQSFLSYTGLHNHLKS